MVQNQFHQPDEAAMERLLEKHWYDVDGVVLRLAWRAGLTRDEIGNLTWDLVDFDARLLRLPDREVPMDAGTVEHLRRWKTRVEAYGPYVMISRRRNHIAPEALSGIARRALDEEGQTDVRLLDLRTDFIRRQFQEHDYPYVLRITGVSLSTYRGGLHEVVGGAPAKEETAPRGAASEEFALWRILQTERTNAAGIALWLTSRLGLQNDEIVRLTWDDVDFDAGALRVGERTVPLTVSVKHVLEDVRALRGPADDPHLILTPKSRRPMDGSRLATVVRDALIRGGLEDRTMLDFRFDAAWEAQRARLRAYIAEHGSVSRVEAATLLDLSMNQTYARLTKLAKAGEVALIKGRYWPADAVIPIEKRAGAVLDLIEENGPVTRKDVMELLDVGRGTATLLLKKMIAEGQLELLPGTKQYAPPEWKQFAEN